MKCFCIFAVCGAILFLADGQVGGGKNSYPLPPERLAREAELKSLLDEAERHIAAGRLEEAIPVLEEAADKEDRVVSPTGHASHAKYRLARLLSRLNRDSKALDTFILAFKWSPEQGDIVHNGPPALQLSMDYALLLSKSGKVEEAKAMFYWGLRVLSGWKSRSIEPVPFLVVFDQESEGIMWEYSPTKFEAAALMLKVMGGLLVEEQKLSLARVRQLAPDWFFPDVWQGAPNWYQERGEVLLSNADALAKPGIEKQLMAALRIELAQHKAALDARCLAPVSDTRPMLEGALRRSRITCLLPKQEVLRRISVGWPGG